VDEGRKEILCQTSETGNVTKEERFKYELNKGS
jgi:hypothetical protein